MMLLGTGSEPIYHPHYIHQLLLNRNWCFACVTSSHLPHPSPCLGILAFTPKHQKIIIDAQCPKERSGPTPPRFWLLNVITSLLCGVLRCLWMPSTKENPLLYLPGYFYPRVLISGDDTAWEMVFRHLLLARICTRLGTHNRNLKSIPWLWVFTHTWYPPNVGSRRRQYLYLPQFFLGYQTRTQLPGLSHQFE